MFNNDTYEYNVTRENNELKLEVLFSPVKHKLSIINIAWINRTFILEF